MSSTFHPKYISFMCRRRLFSHMHMSTLCHLIVFYSPCCLSSGPLSSDPEIPEIS